MGERAPKIVGLFYERQQIAFRTKLTYMCDEVFQMAEVTVHRALHQAF